MCCYQICPETPLSDLIEIFSNHFFKYTFKRKLILPHMKNPQGNTTEIYHSVLLKKVVSFPLFLLHPLPSKLPVAEIM